MKKLICFILIAILFTAGCSPKQNDAPNETAEITSPDGSAATEDPEAAQQPGQTFDPETDYNNRFGMGYDNIIETEDAYYCCSSYASMYLYYFDKATKEWAVLCGKPECMHDEGGRDCNGKIEMVGASLNYWDGRLHYFAIDYDNHGYAFYSLALDGTGRTKDAIFSKSSIVSGDTSPQRFDYHRGKCYGWKYYSEVVDGEPMDCIEIISADPETGEVGLVLKKETTALLSAPLLYYHGNCVYISFNVVVPIMFEDHYEAESNVLCIYRWNIETEELEEVLETELVDICRNGSNYRLYIDAEERILTAPEFFDQTVYMIENGELREIFRFNNPWSFFILDGAAAAFSAEEMAIEIRGLDGSLIYEGELDTGFLDELDPSRGYRIDGWYGMYGDADAVFISFILKSSDGDRDTTCLVRYDMADGTPTPEIIVFKERAY